MQLSTAAFSAARSGNAHAVSPELRDHLPRRWSRRRSRARTLRSRRVRSPGTAFGPSIRPAVHPSCRAPSPREKSASHVTAPVNIPVVFAPSAKVHALTPARRNPEAPWNIPRASVTCDISHWLMSTLNCDLPWNRKLMSVTLRDVPVGHGQLAQPIADARVHRRLELGPGGDVQGTHSFCQYPVGARRHALQYVVGATRGDAGRAAHEGVGAGADGAVEGRQGTRRTRCPCASTRDRGGCRTAARKPGIPCVCRRKYIIRIRDFGCVPALRHLVECVGVVEHVLHGRDRADVPSR